MTRTSTRAAAAVSILAATAGASAASTNEPRAASTCSDVHIFLARGNNEPYPGRQSEFVQSVCDGVESCDYEDLIYSARYTDLYCQIVYDGVIAGHTQLAAYASRCPKSKLVLGGYSVGGQIITDIFAGAGGTFYNGCVQPDLPALSRDNAPGNMIAAALVAGNVRHTGGESFNTGTGSDMSGMFPRSGAQKAALDSWADILRDECIETDPICGDKSLKDGAVVADHLSYYNRLAGDFGKWVQSVAKLDDNSDFHTAIPTSVSGTVQDYATIGTATPSGSVTMHPDWTASTQVVPVTATTDASSSTSTGQSSSVASSTGSTGSGSASPTSSINTQNSVASPTASASSTPNAAPRAKAGSVAALAVALSGVAVFAFAL